MKLLSIRTGILTALAFATLVYPAVAQTNYARHHAFGPAPESGEGPRGPLLLAKNGWCYGTTYQGGSNNVGTLFRIAPGGGDFRVLHHFSDARFPLSGLIETPDGFLCGTSSAGGASNAGTVFRLGFDGDGFQILHTFAPGVATDGDSPLAELILGWGGFLYGTTAGGGSNNAGTVFCLRSDGTDFRIIHHFGALMGKHPTTSLVLGVDGKLYGTTKNGGSNDLGTVYALSTNGNDFTVIHHFQGKAANDGSLPLGKLLQARDGLLYGTTCSGGSPADLGTLYRINTNGNGYSILRAFQGSSQRDGAGPVSGLLQWGQAGVLYGTTPSGGSANQGLAFAINTDGTGFAVMREFTGTGGDGAEPYSPLTSTADGVFYGATYYGGVDDNGTLFRISILPPRVIITRITLGSDGADLQFVGGAAASIYNIEVSPSLAPGSWESIGSRAAHIDGTFQFHDPSTPAHPTRFYRAVHHP